jgi:outer membrane protein assembly factor BamB
MTEVIMRCTRRKKMRAIAVLLFVCVGGGSITAQEGGEWTRFRGPNGAGVADGQKPPVTFGPDDKVLWKQALPPGHSSPIVWRDHIFLTAVDDGALVLMALRQRDGTRLWQHRVPAEGLEKTHPFSSPASSTPATDGERVYAYFGSYGVVAVDFDGKEVWKRPLQLLPNMYGTGTSPIVVDGKVILQIDGGSTESHLLALDAVTGQTAWQVPRPLLRDGWSTPIVARHDGEDEIITVGTSRVVAYGLDGSERWWVAGLPERPITVAVAGAGLLFASAAGTGAPSDPIDIPSWTTLLSRYDADKDGRIAAKELPPEDGIHLRAEVPREAPGNFLPLVRVLHLADADKDEVLTAEEWNVLMGWVKSNQNNVMAIRPGGRGDSTRAHVAWTAQRGVPEMPSLLFYRDRLYLVRDGGMVTSYVADSGAVVLDRHRLGALGQYVASPVAADGRIYAASHTGTIVVFRAADTLDVLARNDLGESITATPAIADDTIYVRTERHLWAFGERENP